MKNKAVLIALLLSTSLPEVGASTLLVPVKYLDASLSRRAIDTSRFPATALANANYIATKREERKACRRSSQPGDLLPLAANSGDQIGVFLESSRFVRKLDEMESRGLNAGRVTRQPWSGDYWAIARGVLGARNFEPEFKLRKDWHERYIYVLGHPAGEILRAGGAAAIHRLSPSEKYDLIIGDDRGKLTEAMWEQGRAYYDRTGEVEAWMGICHGWAPAAIAEPRPTSSIEVSSFGREWSIPLSPAEVKGLVSYSWATNRYNSLMLGGRCTKQNPQRDGNGRLIDPDCFDLNPATWHVAVVNKVGAKKESFVMDATYDYEVWNQPVLEYSYTYFNPETGLPGQLLESQIDLAAFVDDPYRAYRPAAARKVVGIRMKVAYVVETSVSNDPTDSEDRDFVRWVEYKYDLELDSADRIVGGEWHIEAHPDFIWVPRAGIRPQSPLDSALASETWEDGKSIPAKWATAAKYGAPRGVVLDTLTTALLRKSVTAPGSMLLR